jgi:hypothetical protein
LSCHATSEAVHPEDHEHEVSAGVAFFKKKL